MYTLQRNKTQKSWKKTAVAYAILAAFCGIFSVGYLQFSHGESSPFLVWLFAPSLLLGLIPALLFLRTRTTRQPGRCARRIWNSAIATLSCGMLVRSVINISGRYTDYDMIYWVVSGVLFLAVVALTIFRAAKKTPYKPDA